MSEETPPTQDPRPEKLKNADSLVLVNTGNGKGKSTAAFGTVLRTLAKQKKAAVVQFLKSGNWRTGEEKVAKDLGVDWFVSGRGFTWDSDDLMEDSKASQEAWQAAKKIIEEGEHALLVLDEITYPINWGWIDLKEVVSAIEGRPKKVSIIITGRDAPQGLIDIADTVTEMVHVKHAYDKGISAKKGIDY